MFILNDYIKKGFLDAIGKMADYWIILNSSGYHDKGVLTEDDLAEIQSAIDAQYPEIEEEIITDEIITDNVIGNEFFKELTKENTEVTEIIEETEVVESELVE